MKSVFISIPWFTPAFKAGGPIQSVNNLICSYKDQISYKIFCGAEDVDGSAIKTKSFNSWEQFNNQTEIYYNKNLNYFQIFKFWRTIYNFDYLYIIGIYSLKYNIFPLLFSRSKHKILSVRGMLHPGALSQKSIKKKIFLYFLKSIKIQKRILFHATDENEKNYILKIFGEKTKIVIAENYPNIHTNTFKPAKQKNSLILVSVALVSPMKNHLLILNSLKLCKANIEYHIIGAIKDKNYWNLCLKEIEEMPDHIKMIYHGEKEPGEIINYLKKCHVFILPSKSENYGHAIIEALSAGKPIITSKNTPWNNLENSGAGFNVDLDSNSIIDSIDFFVNQNQETYDIYSNNAAAYAKAAIDIHKINQQYNQLFQ